MFNRAVRQMARMNKINWVDIAGSLFEANVFVPDWIGEIPPPDLLVGGNIYAGFRELPIGIAKTAAYRDAIKVLLVRDPRDAIVSEYFSTRLTHSVPEGEGEDGARGDLLRRREAAWRTTIDDFARDEAERMAETVERYIPEISDPRMLVLRYEDIIFDKAHMVRAIAEHFGWTIRPPQIDEILKWIDVRPDVEDQSAFIRKVTPGDHREKLSANAIAYLNTKLQRAMAAFGYE